MIKIKNLRTEKITQVYQVRVDRHSILGNPFYMQNESLRAKVCKDYKDYFYNNLRAVKSGTATDFQKAFYKEIARLYKILKENGKLELFCWCAPKQCHAETIKEFLEKIYKENK